MDQLSTQLITAVIAVPGGIFMIWLIMQVQKGEYKTKQHHDEVVTSLEKRLTDLEASWNHRFSEQQRSFEQHLTEVRAYAEKGWAAADKATSALAGFNESIDKMADSMAKLAQTWNSQRPGK